MASTIRIKRSSTNGNPAALLAGELAYSALAGTQANGGDRLYIGFGTESSGNAANHYVIGGKYFTDMMDHVHGTLTADSALITDSNNKIDVINVGNLTTTGSTNTISATNANGNIVLTPNGTGYVSISGTNGLVIPVGTTAQQGPAIQGAIRYNTTISQFEGYSGTNWSSLGGVRSVDGLTYVIAESSPGASDDIIHFYASNNTTAVEVAQLNTTKLNLLQTTASSSTTTGALVVAGGAGIAGNLYVGGNLVLTGTETAIGSVTFNNGLTLSGSDTAATEYLTLNNASGVTKFQVDTASGNTTIAGTFSVTGTSAHTGNATFGGTVGITGDTTLTGDLAVNGGDITTTATTFNLVNSTATTVNFAGAGTTVNIGAATGTTAIKNNATVAGTLGVTGNTTLSGTANVVGDFSVNTNKFTVAASSGNTAVAGTFSVTGTSAHTGNATFGGTVGITGDLSVNTNKFTVTAASGNTAIAGTLGVAGDVAINTNKFTVAAASGNTVIAGTAGVAGDFAVNTNKFTVVAASGNTSVAGTLAVTGNTTLSGTLAVTGVTTHSANIAMGSNYITGLADPVNPQDAATKAYVDASRNGLDVKQSVRVATTANITLSNTQTVDSIALAAGDRVLVKDQTTASQNGIYVVVSGGAWTRALDANNSADAGNGSNEVNPGMFTFVEEGTTNADSGWVLTNDGTVTLGTTALTFAQFSGAGQLIAGAGLTKTGNQIDVGAGLGITVNANDVALATTVAGAGLTYTSGVLDVVGTANRITVNADSIDIASTYAGQNSIVTVGTLTSGALGTGFTTVAVAQGGTGATTFTSNGVIYGNGTGALQVTAVATVAGSFLRQDASGAPYFSNEIDGGTY
jgi:hypothetical protein